MTLSGSLIFKSANYDASSLSVVPMIKNASGVAVQSSRQRISINAAFGPKHYLNWCVEFPKTAEPVSISLRVEDRSGTPVNDCDFLFVRSEP
jgi:hypothetical protein